jgi:hypothetical protein
MDAGPVVHALPPHGEEEWFYVLSSVKLRDFFDSIN